MKLAEALLLRGDIQKKLASLRERIDRNCLVQEGNAPHEDPSALLGEAAGVIDELERLVSAINIANLKHTLPDGRTLTAAIARRESLVQQHSLLQAAVEFDAGKSRTGTACAKSSGWQPWKLPSCNARSKTWPSRSAS